jgi:ubiquinone/menaquinone biosynthesis C-methylase UbiE
VPAQTEEAELSGLTDLSVGSPNGRGHDESALERVLDAAAVDATARFCGIARMVDAQTRHADRSEPTSEEAQRVEAEFSRLVDVLGTEIGAARSNPMVRQRVRALLIPWLLESRFWCRALLKTRGPGGDFELLEWIYELEDGLASDPTQSVVANVLDGVFSRLASVSGVWYRRAWCRDLIVSTIGRLERPIRILDVAGGGSRYTRDALQLHPGSIRLACTDEDPSAIAYLRAMLPGSALDRVGLLCTSVEHLPDLVPTPTLPEAGFDVVLSTSILDGLDNDAAVLLLRQMSSLTRPGGVTAICASTPETQLRTFREWVSDTQVHYRDVPMVLNLFSANRRALVDTTVSPDRTIICAWVVQ